MSRSVIKIVVLGIVLGTVVSLVPAADIEKIRGRRTSELAKIVGKAHFDEVVHRDNLTVV